MPAKAVFGNYCPGVSVVHRLDPRVKLNLMILVLAAMFTTQGFIGLGIGAAFMLLAWAVAQIPPAYAWASLKPAAFFALFPLVMNILFTKDGEALVSWHALLITDEGLYYGCYYALRLVLMFSSGILVTLTTTSLALAWGFGSMLQPFERFGLPAYEISLMMRIALSFMSDIGRSFSHIQKAQSARGAVFDSGGPLKRLAALVPCLVPLFAQCIRNAENLGLAMEGRCYHGGSRRSSYRQYKVGRNDYLALGLAGCLLAAVISLRLVA